MKILFYDLETTGLKYWRNGIHQISGIVDIDGEVAEEFDFRVAPNPKCKIEDGALKIAGVDFNTVINYPKMGYVHAKFTGLLQKHVDKYNSTDKFVLCGYNNASFDDPFLRAFFKQNGDKYFASYFYNDVLDVRILAMDHLKEIRHTMPNFKLMSVARQMGVEVDESQLHDAMYDVRITREVYVRLTDEKGIRVVSSKSWTEKPKKPDQSNPEPGKSGTHGILL